MREINIAKVIVAKRKEKGITQDELADYIGVSKASVSKWENAQSYPDITLLPQLAAYFNISIDELIDYLPQMTSEDIKKTYHRLATDFSSKPFKEVLDECHSIIKKYYSCFPLLLQMAALILNHFFLAKDKAEQDSIVQEIVDMCQRIIEESEDVWIIKQANSIRAKCFIVLNRPGDTLEILDGTLKPLLADEIMLATAYSMLMKIDKAKMVMQVSIYQYLIVIIGFSQSYLMLTKDQPAKFEKTLERFLKLCEVFELRDLNPNIVAQLYYAAAVCYASQNNEEKTLEMLGEFSFLCTKKLLPYKLKGDEYFDLVEEWFKDYDSDAPRDEKAIKESALVSVTENPVFSFLYDNLKYKNIVKELKAFIGGD